MGHLGWLYSLTSILDISTALMRPRRPKQYCLQLYIYIYICICICICICIYVYNYLCGKGKNKTLKHYRTVSKWPDGPLSSGAPDDQVPDDQVLTRSIFSRQVHLTREDHQALSKQFCSVLMFYFFLSHTSNYKAPHL